MPVLKMPIIRARETLTKSTKILRFSMPGLGFFLPLDHWIERTLIRFAKHIFNGPFTQKASKQDRTAHLVFLYINIKYF